jgi:hypothetical protein
MSALNFFLLKPILQPVLKAVIPPHVSYIENINFLLSETAAGFSLSRDTTSRVRTASGLWTPRAAGEALLGYHNAVGAPQGWHLPGAFTDYHHNRTLAGAVLGVLGAGGALPTHWGPGTAADLTTTVVAIGVWNGLPSLRLRIQGTATDWRLLRMSLRNWVKIAAAAGDVLRLSTFLKRVAGTWPDGSTFFFRLQTDAYDAGVAYLNSVPSAGIADPGPSFSRITATSTLTHASTALAEPYLEWIVAPATEVDLTFEIAAPMLVKNVPAPEIVLLDSGAADVASAAEVATRALSGLVPPFTLRLQGRTAAADPGADQVLACLDADANNWVRLVRRTATNAVNLEVQAAGAPVANLALGTVDNDTQFAVAARIATNDVAASRDGGAAVADASAAVPTPVQLTLGAHRGGTLPWWGFCEMLRIERGGKANAGLEGTSLPF